MFSISLQGTESPRAGDDPEWGPEQRDAFVLEALDTFAGTRVLPDGAGPLRTKGWMRRRGYPEHMLREATSETAQGVAARANGQLELWGEAP